MTKTTRQLILDLISDLVADFLYYDRKEDDELGVGGIEAAVEAGDISVSEMAAAFKNELWQAFEE